MSCRSGNLSLLVGLALVAALGGCNNEPDRSLIGVIDNGGGATGGGPSGQPALRAVALDDRMLFGSNSPHASGQVWILVETRSGHANHRIEESVGGGPFIRTSSAVLLAGGGAPARIPTATGSNWTGLVFGVSPTQPAAATRFRVAAWEGASGTDVYSNVIEADFGVVGNPDPVTIQSPQTGPSPMAPATLAAAPARIDFLSNSSRVTAWLVVLVSDRGEHHSMVEERSGTSHVIGSRGALAYETGGTPLASGTWGIAVLGLDRTGWAVAASADPQLGVQHWFRVP